MSDIYTRSSGMKGLASAPPLHKSASFMPFMILCLRNECCFCLFAYFMNCICFGILHSYLKPFFFKSHVHVWWTGDLSGLSSAFYPIRSRDCGNPPLWVLNIDGCFLRWATAGEQSPWSSFSWSKSTNWSSQMWLFSVCNDEGTIKNH